ncbi:MAG: murein biosynthesis integral membrane protein MurJ [Beijerinckiaceae bacterium]
MLKKILSVSGITLVSRLTGFLRDILLAAVLGAGMRADALVVAMKLPNHFRAIFAEGAFNAAYVPALTRLHQSAGERAARLFASKIQTVLLLSQIILLALAMAFMPLIVRLLAPGFVNDPEKFRLAVDLSRITFPYLLFMALLAQYTGSLASAGRFIAGAVAPVLLNVSMIAALLMAAYFPTAAHAAAWGIFAAGIAEFLLVAIAARRASVMPGLARPDHDPAMKNFWSAFWPGVIGSSGVQIAMFADLILSTLLPEGAPSHIYYADRIYQLPIGVIAVAAGTVLLPEMSRRIAAGDENGAHHQQSRTFLLTLILAGPCIAAFIAMPHVIMRGVFQRGAFTVNDAYASGEVLAAYALGLPAIVLIRSAVASFHARGDTKTPMMISFAAIAVNVALKIILAPRIGAPGLALATAAGAWINLGVISFLALRRNYMQATPDFLPRLLVLTIATVSAGAVFVAAERFIPPFFPATFGLRDFVLMAAIGLPGVALYTLMVLAGFRLTQPRQRSG